MKPFNLFVVVQPGLEDIVLQELNALGYRNAGRIKGGFFLKGHLSTVIKLNINCRCASRIFIDIAEFEAKSFSQLEKRFARVGWNDYLSDQNICLHVNSFQSLLYHEKAIAERLLHSLSERFGRVVNLVSSPDEENTQLINIRVKHDLFTVRMDTSGAHQHKRGYGRYKQDAPLRETVAAGLMHKTRWGVKYALMADPLCGSGTIAIEAALIAKKIPSCEFRSFAFQKFAIFDPDTYNKVRNEAWDNVIENPSVSILASDIDVKAVESAQRNAERAGVSDIIDFKVCPVGKINLDKACSVITNPPWGKRISDNSIHEVWAELKRFATQGSDVYFLLPEMLKSALYYKYQTLLRFRAGDIKVEFVKLEV